MLQKYTSMSAKPLRWHDGSVGDVGQNSILETDTNNIVVLGGVFYVAGGSQVNVLINGAGSMIGIGETQEDLPVKEL
jgi:hypothetical protein